MTIALLTIFRVFHIFAGVFWVGAATLLAFFITPAASKAGPAGGRFMLTLNTQTAYEMFMPIVSVVTTLSGIALYALRGGFSASYYSSLGNWILAIGSLAGILAFGHGSAVMGRLTGEVTQTGQQMASAEGPPPAELQAKMVDLQGKLTYHGRISFALMVIAVLGMSLARYL